MLRGLTATPSAEAPSSAEAPLGLLTETTIAVYTAEELILAILAAERHIEVRAHLDLTNLDKYDSWRILGNLQLHWPDRTRWFQSTWSIRVRPSSKNFCLAAMPPPKEPFARIFSMNVCMHRGIARYLILYMDEHIVCTFTTEEVEKSTSP